MKNSIVKTAISILVFGAVPLAASAQSVSDNELSSCAKIESVVGRLACFDELATKHGLSVSVTDTTTPENGKWATSTKKDPMTDKAVYTAILLADSGTGQFGAPIAMAIRCKDNTTDMYIDWSSYLGQDDIRTTFRFDKDAAKSSRWPLSTDSKAAFYPGSPISALKRLAQSTSFVASVTPYNENPVTVVFDTTGAAKALMDVRKGCNW